MLTVFTFYVSFYYFRNQSPVLSPFDALREKLWNEFDINLWKRSPVNVWIFVFLFKQDAEKKSSKYSWWKIDSLEQISIEKESTEEKKYLLLVLNNPPISVSFFLI